MARKAKAKRPGRPTLAKAKRREVRSVRLTGELWARVEGYCKATRTEVTAAVERALTAWLDEWEGRAHEIMARRTDEE